MNMMKLAWQKFPCVLGSAFPPIRLCPGLSLSTKGIGPLAAPLLLLVTCYFLLATFHLATTSLVTATFSACSYYLAENCLPEPSAPRWVRHSYLSKGLRLIPYTCGSSIIRSNNAYFLPKKYKKLSSGFGNFRFLHTKNTIVILLKTTSVRVSSK